MNFSNAPQAPDPVATAKAAEASNKATAVTQQNLNSTNQITPYGNLTYNQIGNWSDGTPHYEATTSFSPEQQGLYNLATQMQKNYGTIGVNQSQKVMDTLSNPFDLNAATGTQQSDIQRKLLDPVWQMRADQEETRLRNQGYDPQSDAYRNAMRDFNMNRDNSYNSALLSSRAQAVAEALAQRNQPLTELNALLSGTQPQSPNFVGTPQANVQATDVGGIYNAGYQNQLAQYSANQAPMMAAIGGLAGLGGSALGGWGMGGFKGLK